MLFLFSGRELRAARAVADAEGGPLARRLAGPPPEGAGRLPHPGHDGAAHPPRRRRHAAGYCIVIV